MFIKVSEREGTMAKGIPSGRSENLRIATITARNYLLESRQWPATSSFMANWLRLKYGLSRSTVNDYLSVIESRLRGDQGTAAIFTSPPPVFEPVFKNASDLV